MQANIDKATRARDLLCDALIATNRVETLKPEGAIYAFLKIDGVKDAPPGSPRHRRQDRRRPGAGHGVRRRAARCSCAPASCAIRPRSAKRQIDCPPTSPPSDRHILLLVSSALMRELGTDSGDGLMAVLVTGGAGYIGTHMVWALLDAGEDVVVLDRLSTGFRWAIAPEARFYEGDIADRDARCGRSSPRTRSTRSSISPVRSSCRNRWPTR